MIQKSREKYVQRVTKYIKQKIRDKYVQRVRKYTMQKRRDKYVQSGGYRKTEIFFVFVCR